MNYALVENGIVLNIICIAGRSAADFPNAVKLGDRPVIIGDSYADGKFYRDGAEVLTPLEKAQIELEDMRAALAELGVE